MGVERRLKLWQDLFEGGATALSLPEGDAPAPAEARPRFDALGAHLGAAEPAPLARAALAHIAAHRLFGSPRFDGAGLRPIQIALISLIEDARIEALAIERLPGLRRLWGAFHAEEVPVEAGVPDLLHRLARALLDPMEPDGHAWVEKGRRLFLDARRSWHDPLTARRIGGLLGHDLGQMRLPFNGKTYAVWPAYRDDHSGIWRLEAPAAAPSAEAEGAIRPDWIEAPEAATPRETPAASRPGAAAAEAVAAQGPILLSLPEWDYAIGRARPDWVTIREEAIRPADPAAIEAFLVEQGAVADGLARLLRTVLSVPARRGGLHRDGDLLDIDAAIRSAIDRRAGLPVEARLYRRPERAPQDLALFVLLDASLSTADTLPGGGTVLDLGRQAAALLVEAAVRAGQSAALAAFRSDGRRDVRIAPLKAFQEPWRREPWSRLAGLEAGASTRLGAALRHAVRAIEGQQAARRVLVVATDGKPSDVDVPDRRYLIEDARRAVAEAAGRGIESFCLGLNEAMPATGDLDRIFGRHRVIAAGRPQRPGDRLRQLLFRLRG